MEVILNVGIVCLFKRNEYKATIRNKLMKINKNLFFSIFDQDSFVIIWFELM